MHGQIAFGPDPVNRQAGDRVELRNLLQVADLIVRSAHLRHESRGLHYSLDYPEKTNLPQPTILTPAG